MTFESVPGVVRHFQVRGVNANGGHRVGLGSSGEQRFRLLTACSPQGPQPAPVTRRTHYIAGMALQADGLAWIHTRRSMAPPAIPNFLCDSLFDAGQQKSKKLQM